MMIGELRKEKEIKMQREENHTIIEELEKIKYSDSREM